MAANLKIIIRDGFDSIKAARGWASGKRLLHRGVIIDQTEEAQRG